MKTLTTEQQADLLELFAALKLENAYNTFEAGVRGDINYWAIELKPKRVRRNLIQPAETA